MAQKRMFSLSVVDTDKFLDMPVSARLLYYELGMRADDDGFVDNCKKILLYTGLREDDLKLLIAKSFIIPFESGVIVIRHWRMNNYLQNDRIKPTLYQEELHQLGIDKNNVYTLDTDCIHSIDKNSIDKNNIYINTCSNATPNDTTNAISNETLFEAFWKAYPKKKNKGSAEKWFKTHKPSKDLVDKMLEMIEKQKNTIDWKKNDGQFIPYPSTWLNAKGWEDEINTKTPTWFDKDIQSQEATSQEQQEMEELLKEWK